MKAAGSKEELSRLVDLTGAVIARTSLRHANLTDAILSGANCSYVDFRGANMLRTKLRGTILVGALLSEVKNLTREQVSEAIFDHTTVLPDYLSDMRPKAAE